MNIGTIKAIACQVDLPTFLARFPEPMLVVRRADAGPLAGELDWKVRTKLNPETKRHERPSGLRLGQSSVEIIAKSERNPFAGMITVGRANNNDIAFPVASVSKLHAYFQKEGAHWVIRDSNSANGTFVDGKRLEPNGSSRVDDGLSLRFGPDTECLFKTPSGLYALLQKLPA